MERAQFSIYDMVNSIGIQGESETHRSTHDLLHEKFCDSISRRTWARHILFGFASLCVADTVGFCFWFFGFFFYRLKVCGKPALSKPVGAIFPTAFAHFPSPNHILVNSYNISNSHIMTILYYYCMAVTCDQ